MLKHYLDQYKKYILQINQEKQELIDHLNYEKNCNSSLKTKIKDISKEKHKPSPPVKSLPKKIRVLLVCGDITNIGGAAQNTYELLKILALENEFDAKCLFISNLSPDNLDPDYVGNIFHIKLDENIETTMSKFRNKHEFDVIFCKNYKIFPIIHQSYINVPIIYSPSGVRYIGIKIKDKWINDISKEKDFWHNLYNYKTRSNDNLFKFIKDNDKRLEKYIFANASHILCNSLLTHNLVSNYFNVQNLKTDKILEYINLTNIKLTGDHVKDNFTNREYDIGFVAYKWRTYKNYDLLVKLVNSDDLAGKKIIVIGLEQKPELYNQQVTSIPNINDNNIMKEYYQKIKTIVITSKYDSNPNVLVEAVNNGCNVVTSKNVGNHENLDKKLIVADHTDINEWTARINISLKKKYIYKGYNKSIVKEKFMNVLKTIGKSSTKTYKSVTTFNHPICNNMTLNKIKDGFTWIHGKGKNNILITIFIISIEDSQLKNCVDSINNLSLNYNVLINVVQNIYPTNKSYNQMRIRCKTKYFIQLDEDMMLNHDAIDTMMKTKHEDAFLNIYRLKDDYLGIENSKWIYGIKLYNQDIMRNYPTLHNGDIAVSSVDRCWHKPILDDGHKKKSHKNIVGYHEKDRNGFDLLLKYSKITNNLIDKYTINANEISWDDFYRLMIPARNIDIYNILLIIYQHLYLLCSYNQERVSYNSQLINDIFKKYLNKLPTFENKDKYEDTYNVSKYYKIDHDIFKLNINKFFDFFNLHNNIFDIYAVAGIINRVFDNYQYSYIKYPINIKYYMNRFLDNQKICIISHQLPNIGGSSTNAYSLFNFLSKKYGYNTSCIFIDNENLLNNKKLIPDKISYLKKFNDITIITDEKDLIKTMGNVDLVIFRYPQFDTSKIDFQELKKHTRKIISIFGGGYRNNFSRTCEKIKETSKNLTFNDIAKAYNSPSQITNNEISEKYIDILTYSDEIYSNTDLYDSLFKKICRHKYKGYYYLSSINKTNHDITRFYEDPKWLNRKYDLMIVTSSLTRTVKGFLVFLEIIKDSNYKVLVIGKNFDRFNLTNPNIDNIPYSHDIESYMKNSKLVISTSLFEASPNNIFEAINNGCNILISKLIGNHSIFKDECLTNNYIDINEWREKIANLLAEQINPLKINIAQNINEFNHSIMNFGRENKLVLIITFLEESINQPRLHYSKAKGYLLADGLINNGYIPFFLTNQIEYITYEHNYYYINHKLLTPQILARFKYIFFGLHNNEYLIPLYKTNIYSAIQHAKNINPDLKVINKTCMYPTILNSYFNSFNFFDKIFLQTQHIKLPDTITKHYSQNIIDHKIAYSEMTFPNKELTFSKTESPVTRILYMGRLNAANGMNIIYLIKLMKILGDKYKLYVIPGSFKLPTDYPAKKRSPKNNKIEFNAIKQFFENYELKYDKRNASKKWKDTDFTEKDWYCKKCNIEVLPLMTYGQHFDIIKQFDIGIGFSANKSKKVPEGSAKLFDYMYCKLKVVFENGWSNCDYITKYNFGKLISTNSTTYECAEAIKDIEKANPDTIRHDEFINQNNLTKRCEELLSKI